MPYKTDKAVSDKFKETFDTYAFEFPRIRQEVIDFILSQRAEDRKGLREKIEGMRKYSGDHNKAHTWITNGYCHACKKMLSAQQLEDEFGYNQALSDVLALLDNQEGNDKTH